MSSSSKDRLVSHPHQSLLRHLQSVDEVSGRALEGKVLSSDLFDEVDANTLRKLLVYFHDFGKGHDFFQHRITEVARKENPEMEGLDGEYVRAFEHHPDRALLEEAKYDPLLKGHSTLGAFVVQTALPEDASPLLRVIIYEAIARHHGNLKNFDAGAERGVEGHEATLEGQWPRMNHADYRAILATTEFGYKQDLKAIQAAYPELFFGRVYRKLNRNEALKPYLQTVFLFSLLLAGDKGDMMLRERQMIGRVRRMQSRLIEQYKAHMFGAGAPSLMNKWREEAYQRVAQTLADHPDAGFYSITLPTGMGKTLTAYNAAVQLQNQMTDQLAVTNPNCTPRVIYCLPFTSVIDQNAAILEEILALDGVTGELAKHHYLADWPDKREESEGQLEYSEKEYLVEGWEYSLTVTTFVQLLETLVSNRNRKLRKFHNLANAIVILDEVQSIPPKYFNLVSDVLTAIHETMGTRFVFVTATQPFMMREQSAVIELTDPTKAYTKLAFERMNRIDLDLSLWVDGPDDLNEQAEVFADAARNEDRSFLIILNLVAQSREVFLRLADEALPEVDYIYLSSAVLPIERKRRIAQIQAKDDGRRKVVVSTQVVEAGVDIDLDVVYRAFAPLDSINQSAGRCNRSMRAGFRGSVRLFRSEKAAKIYDKTLLKKTERVLKKQQKEARLAAEYRENILPEACFYAMNEKYAGEVRRAVADENAVSAEILDDLKKLRFEDAERKFKLIDKAYTTYGVFIDAPEELPKVTHRNPVSGEDEELTCTEVYQRMLHILHDDDLGRWEKKQELRLLRPALLQYVVQFPEYAMPAHLQQDAEGKPFIRLTAKDGDHDYRQCYDIVTGYFKPEDKPTQSF